MSNRKTITDLIKRISGQAAILTIPRVYIALLEGDHLAALLLSQIVYWSDRSTRSDGGFFKSYREWEEELGMTQYQVGRAVKKIRRVIGEDVVQAKLKRAKAAPTLHYYLDAELLTNSIIKFLDNRETQQSDYEETQQSDYEETSQTLTEITHKTTKQEITKDGAAAPHPLDPPSPLSDYLFGRLNDDRDTKGRTPVKRYGTAQQRDETEAALAKLDRAGEMQNAVDWALRNERTSRSALCNAVIAWAKNLDKPKPTAYRNGSAPSVYDILDKLEAERER